MISFQCDDFSAILWVKVRCFITTALLTRLANEQLSELLLPLNEGDESSTSGSSGSSNGDAGSPAVRMALDALAAFKAYKARFVP